MRPPLPVSPPSYLNPFNHDIPFVDLIIPVLTPFFPLRIKEYVVKGIDNAGQAFLDLLTGDAFGKVVISLED